MALIVVSSANPGDGKTGVAAAVARHYAYAGAAVRLARLATPEPSVGARDAELLASLEFAPASTPAAIQPSDVVNPPAGELLVLEAEADALAGLPVAQVVFVTRSAAAAVPDAAAAVVVIGSRGEQPDELGRASVHVQEDRTLAGFSIAEAKAMLRAETLVEGDRPATTTCDYLVIAPFGSDAGQPYFRRFPSKAVVGRFDRTDMHLAAIRADADALILTGGRYPSDYVFDAARATGTPLLLSATDTENTVISLEALWDHTRFTGERKLDRMAELIEGTALFEALEV